MSKTYWHDSIENRRLGVIYNNYGHLPVCGKRPTYQEILEFMDKCQWMTVRQAFKRLASSNRVATWGTMEAVYRRTDIRRWGGGIPCRQFVQQHREFRQSIGINDDEWLNLSFDELVEYLPYIEGGE